MTSSADSTPNHFAGPRPAGRAGASNDMKRSAFRSDLIAGSRKDVNGTRYHFELPRQRSGSVSGSTCGAPLLR
jgi:hypothetical protein